MFTENSYLSGGPKPQIEYSALFVHQSANIQTQQANTYSQYCCENCWCMVSVGI